MNSIETLNLSKKIGKKNILTDISFSIKSGETIGLIGRNGAGKTSILKCIAGLWNYKSGVIKINGKIAKKENFSKISALIEYPSLYSNLTLNENIEYFGILSNCEYRQKSIELLKLLDLTKSADRKIQTFSSGMKQKACLVIALMTKPEILLLDEPTSMLDPISSTEILKFIKNLKNEKLTIFISSHNLNELEGLCDRVIIIDNGRILRTIDLKEQKKKYLLEFTDLTELNRVVKAAKEYEILINENDIIFIGDANTLKQFIIKINPNLRDIKNIKALDIAYCKEGILNV